MVAKVFDTLVEEHVIAERRRLGIDRFDEVWDGVYVMSPLASDEHQKIATFISGVLTLLIQLPKRGEVRQGINLTDRPDDWTHNFRCPDVVVFLPGGSGVCHGAFWSGGPDFAVEVASPGESPSDKFEFYGRVGLRELLIVYRDPWRLELLGPEPNGMRLLQRAEIGQAGVSTALELTFSLHGSEDDPELTITHRDGRVWSI